MNSPTRGWFRVCCSMLVALFLMQAVGCGTILYPDRRGQGGGRIDVGVAVLDGVGLLLFIIPGIIAYAVDFTTGAIYLPHGKHRASLEGKIRVVRVDPAKLTDAGIDDIVRRETGIDHALNRDRTQVQALRTGEELQMRLSRVIADGYRAQ